MIWSAKITATIKKQITDRDTCWLLNITYYLSLLTLLDYNQPQAHRDMLKTRIQTCLIQMEKPLNGDS